MSRIPRLRGPHAAVFAACVILLVAARVARHFAAAVVQAFTPTFEHVGYAG